MHLYIYIITYFYLHHPQPPPTFFPLLLFMGGFRHCRRVGRITAGEAHRARNRAAPEAGKLRINRPEAGETTKMWGN